MKKRISVYSPTFDLKKSPTFSFPSLICFAFAFYNWSCGCVNQIFIMLLVDGEDNTTGYVVEQQQTTSNSVLGKVIINQSHKQFRSSQGCCRIR